MSPVVHDERNAASARRWDWRALRDRLLADPRFQRLAAAFPPTRRIARRESRALFDLCAGFVYSQVLLACVELRLFDVLRDGMIAPDALAARLGLEPAAARRLLEAAAALRLVEGDAAAGWRLGPLGAVLSGSPGIAAMVEHHRLLYEDLRDPVALLRGGGAPTRLAQFWSYARADAPAEVDPAGVAAYSALMSESQSLVADDVLDAYPVRRHRRLLDVGGGEGAFLAAVAHREPGLRLTLFDLPPVTARARQRLEGAGLAGRIAIHSGDFLADPLPQGADLISLVRVVHDHDDSDAVRLLRAVRAALPPDGALLIAEPMSGQAGTEPMADAYFGFYLMAMGQGRPRTPEAVIELARAAGFREARLLRTARPLLASVVVARP
ncbi:MAG TPA: methyltransferase [Myxococcota bacterium]|nr:methyltransferase [Myxococcota bacterium]